MCSSTHLVQGYFQTFLSFWKNYAFSTTSTYSNSWQKQACWKFKTKTERKKKQQIRNRKTKNWRWWWESERDREKREGGSRGVGTFIEQAGCVYMGVLGQLVWCDITHMFKKQTQKLDRRVKKWRTRAGTASACQLRGKRQWHSVLKEETAPILPRGSKWQQIHMTPGDLNPKTYCWRCVLQHPLPVLMFTWKRNLRQWNLHRSNAGHKR